MMRGLRSYLGRLLHSLSRMLARKMCPPHTCCRPSRRKRMAGSNGCGLPTKFAGQCSRISRTSALRAWRRGNRLGAFGRARRKLKRWCWRRCRPGRTVSAGVAHVRFNSSGQALASRIVRQWDKRLTMVGVVHTHPGSLRHPSDGDYQGDSQWVGQLRGGDGIFGIGTADAKRLNGPPVAQQRSTHRQILDELCFSWYCAWPRGQTLSQAAPGSGLGPDLAKPLHPVWDVIETHAEALDCLCRQQAGVTL